MEPLSTPGLIICILKLAKSFVKKSEMVWTFYSLWINWSVQRKKEKKTQMKKEEGNGSMTYTYLPYIPV